MKMQESAENYLETILMIKQEHGAVRSVDIANHMGFTKASVSRAVGLLKKEQYITVASDGWIELTDKGMEIAQGIYARHKLVSQWLMSIGVPKQTALNDACRMEHGISEITFQKLKEYIMSH